MPELCICSSSLLCLQIQLSQHCRRLIIPWSLLTSVIELKTSERKEIFKPFKKKKNLLSLISHLSKPQGLCYLLLNSLLGEMARYECIFGALLQLTLSFRPLWCTGGCKYPAVGCWNGWSWSFSRETLPFDEGTGMVYVSELLLTRW